MVAVSLGAAARAVRAAGGFGGRPEGAEGGGPTQEGQKTRQLNDHHLVTTSDSACSMSSFEGHPRSRKGATSRWRSKLEFKFCGMGN